MSTDPVVTTPDFTDAERAAWEVAVERGLRIEAVDLRAMLDAAAPLLAEAVAVTDEMVERACRALWWNPDVPCLQPYSAHARDFVGMLDEYSDEEKAPGGQRERDLDRFQAASEDAEQMSRAVMRRTLEAALSPEVPGDRT